MHTVKSSADIAHDGLVQSNAGGPDETIKLCLPGDRINDGLMNDQVRMVCCPIITQPPIVKRRVLGQPDQSVSE